MKNLLTVLFCLLSFGISNAQMVRGAKINRVFFDNCGGQLSVDQAGNVTVNLPYKFIVVECVTLVNGSPQLLQIQDRDTLRHTQFLPDWAATRANYAALNGVLSIEADQQPNGMPRLAGHNYVFNWQELTGHDPATNPPCVLVVVEFE